MNMIQARSSLLSTIGMLLHLLQKHGRQCGDLANSEPGMTWILQVHCSRCHHSYANSTQRLRIDSYIIQRCPDARQICILCYSADLSLLLLRYPLLRSQFLLHPGIDNPVPSLDSTGPSLDTLVCALGNNQLGRLAWLLSCRLTQ